LAREQWALQRTGEENEPAVADADRAEHRKAIFGQTCPIETAVDVPAARSRGTAMASSVATNGNGCIARPRLDRMVGANDCMWEVAGNGAFSPSWLWGNTWMTTLMRAHLPSTSSTEQRLARRPISSSCRSMFPPVNPFLKEAINGRVANNRAAD
jgi:hypothetical protein